MMKGISKKDDLGITLIALVITIVVLIILAAVAINLSLGNNGIFNRAKTAKEKYANAQEYEQTEVDKTGDTIDGYVDGNRDTVTIPKEEYNRLLQSSNANNYTDQEQVVGTWLNGTKKLYQKTLNIGALPNATTKTVQLNVTNLDTVVSFLGYAKITSSGVTITLPWSEVGGVSCSLFYDGTGGLCIRTNGNLSSYNSSYVTVQYTKTVD